ncbi:transcriptional regulator, TetR family [[Leptolyngbya] sp. PCC 7376]|uniref:TetR/AcrR family transcriptional regulator n=1 Tax=[Leptolyngbya] sp. PCC 7376 TaxID=111781 RepID=UPI00029EE2B6|nr:TetR/AcrR family transcriptional regulator [[Leptolyngbya] sp. PCC 7376]AFY36511.1 transcriptional regulator, TetR family [[Leptolyngbya] sp. PCC 7376]
MPKPPRSVSKKQKQSRNPEATKAKILAAATEEFAQYGLSGARTGAIASRSGITKAMLCYYFQNKETLYRRVLQGLVDDINQAFQPINWEALSPRQALEAVARSYITFEISNRHHGMLWFQEAIQNQGRYGAETGWQSGFHDIVDILERGIATGEFRPLDPFLTAINILGVCSFYFDAHENLKYLDAEKNLLSAEMVEQQTEAAIEFILAGVTL